MSLEIPTKSDESFTLLQVNYMFMRFCPPLLQLIRNNPTMTMPRFEMSIAVTIILSCHYEMTQLGQEHHPRVPQHLRLPPLHLRRDLEQGVQAFLTQHVSQRNCIPTKVFPNAFASFNAIKPELEGKSEHELRPVLEGIFFYSCIWYRL